MSNVVKQIAPPTENGATCAPFWARARVRRWTILIVILWLALFLRVWQLDTLPPGLHYDEAFNGTMAREVLRGLNRPIFFTPNFGEEPMHIYTEAIFFALIGESPWAIRLVSAFYGVLFVAAVYACARAFFPRSDVLALAAAFLAATLLWALMFSRIGIETITLAPMIALSAAALGFMYRRWSWTWVIGAGFLFGASIYTYLASRVYPFVVLLWFAYLVALHRDAVRHNLKKWIVFGVVASVTVAPLAWFFVQNPVALSGRSGTVFTPEMLGNNLLRTALMFFFNGDTDPRDNLPGRAALDIFLAIFFLIGLVVSALRSRKPFYALLLIWLVVMCLPSALTEFAPNFRRALGALPALILLCAVGVDWVWMKIADWRLEIRKSKIENRKSKLAGYALIVLVVFVSAFWTARAYFGEWASNSGLFYSFDAGLLRVGKMLAARPREETLCLSPQYNEHYTVIWALDGRPLISFDGRRVLVLPDSKRAVTCGIITPEDAQTSENLVKAYGGSQLPQNVLDATGKSYATLITFPKNSRQEITPQHPRAVRAGDFASLIGFDVEHAAPQNSHTVRVRLYWTAERAAEKNYTVFVQLVGPQNSATNSPLWAQADKQPGEGTYPTTRWQSGDVIIEDYVFKLPPEAVPGEYKIQTGMYVLETGARVPLIENAARLENDAVTLTTFSLP